MQNDMQLTHTVLTLQQQLRQLPQPVALVPTMGALHEGHMALIAHAKTMAASVVVSIFVNPTQFGPHEDFSAYPRMLEADLERCGKAGVALVFAPEPLALYPTGTQPERLTQVVPPASLTDCWCGQSRPGHFTGVATVVCKLLTLIQPQVVVFGQKDAQQVAVLQAVLEHLNMPVVMSVCPVVRDVSGLALSSRNQYLTTSNASSAALLLSQTLFLAKSSRQPLAQCLETCLAQHSPEVRALFRLDYLACVHPQTLQPVDFHAETSVGSLLLMAAFIETPQRTVRLIDCVPL